MPHARIPTLGGNRNRGDLTARMSTAVDSRWWHPGAYLLIAVLIVAGDVADAWWLTFAAACVAVLSAAAWGLHAYIGPLIEQEQQRRAVINTALGDAARAMRAAADLMQGVAEVAAAREATLKPTTDSLINPTSRTTTKGTPA